MRTKRSSRGQKFPMIGKDQCRGSQGSTDQNNQCFSNSFLETLEAAWAIGQEAPPSLSSSYSFTFPRIILYFICRLGGGNKQEWCSCTRSHFPFMKWVCLDIYCKRKHIHFVCIVRVLTIRFKYIISNYEEMDMALRKMHQLKKHHNLMGFSKVTFWGRSGREKAGEKMQVLLGGCNFK